MLNPKVENGWEYRWLEEVCVYFQQKCKILNSKKSDLQKERYYRKIKAQLYMHESWICDSIERSLLPRFYLPVRNMNEKLPRTKMERLLFPKSLYPSGKPPRFNNRLKDTLTNWAIASVRQYDLSRTQWLQEAARDEEWLRDFLELAFSIPVSGIFFPKLTKAAFYAQGWPFGYAK